MERENRYLVIKRTDLEFALENLPDHYGDILSQICKEIDAVREVYRKQEPLKCVVVEHDWPEYESTWQAIAKRVDGHQDHKD